MFTRVLRYYECCNRGRMRLVFNPFSRASKNGEAELFPAKDCPYCPKEEKALRTSGVDLGMRPSGEFVKLKTFTGDWDRIPSEGKTAVVRAVGAFNIPSEGRVTGNVTVKKLRGKSALITEHLVVSEDGWLTSYNNVTQVFW